jgi:hypothetical protein
MIDKNFRGRGIYKNMLKKTTNILLNYSIRITIGTQLDNYVVQRTCQNLDYRIIKKKHILHYKDR